MFKYSFLVLIYLISVASSSIANSIDANVQIFYRVPFLNLRWIDISISIIIIGFLRTKRIRLKNTDFIVFLCLMYLMLDSVQLIRSLGLSDTTAQVSHFFCTLSLFILIDLSIYPLPIDEVILFLKKFAIQGAFVIIIINFYLLYSFFSGHVIYEDFGIRVGLKVIGGKESVYSFILTSFVYAFGLFFVQRKGSSWLKALFLLAILSILTCLVIQIFRGTLIMVILITVYFLITATNIKQTLAKLVGVLIFISLVYLMFGSALVKKGYNPVKEIIATAEYATDVNSPNWSHGRSVPQEYAIKAWENNFWIGAGFDELQHYGLPSGENMPHNGIIDLLFHGGILGTSVYIFILILLFKHAIKLWYILRKSSTYESEMVKILVFVSFLWIITFMTQEALWEKYSLCIEFLFLGLVTNIYKQLSINNNVYEI